MFTSLSAVFSNLALLSKAGSWPVMLTPFTEAGRIDWEAFDALVEWYVAGDSQGLFSACLSSEIFHLTEEERLALVRRTVGQVAGRLPVIASGALPTGISLRSAVSSPEEVAQSVEKVAATGAQAVILLTNQFAYSHESEDVWKQGVDALLNILDPSISLGLYECPVPYKRELSAQLVGWAAQTGRFHFLKDTCCDLSLIRSKLAALQGTPLRFYNAHTATLLRSLQAGGHGFSGVGANAVPHLYAWLCGHFADKVDLAEELQDFLEKSSPAVDIGYPYSVKTYLGLNGLPISTFARLGISPLTSTQVNGLAEFHHKVEDWEKRLGLNSPFFITTASTS